MANTKKEANGTITLSAVDADYSFPRTLPVTSIVFLDPAVDDKIVFHNRAGQPTESSQPDDVVLESTDGNDKIQYLAGENIDLRFDIGNSTIDQGAKIVIKYKYYSFKGYQPLG